RPDDKDRLAAGLTGRQGPELSKAGGRMHAGWVYRWLEAPDRMRPGAVMPRLFADDDTGKTERYAVATYLASLGGPVPRDKEEAAKRTNVLHGQKLFASVGCVACHNLKGEHRAEGAVSAFPLTALGTKTTPAALTTYLLNPLAVDPSGRMPHMLLQ